MSAARGRAGQSQGPRRRGAAAEADPGPAFAALAEPTRRRVVSLLAGGPQRAGDLAAALDLAPAALSRHLRVLRKSGLIVDEEPEHDARVRLYRLEPGGVLGLQRWLAQLEREWSSQLAAFKAHAERHVDRAR